MADNSHETSVIVRPLRVGDEPIVRELFVKGMLEHDWQLFLDTLTSMGAQIYYVLWLLTVSVIGMPVVLQVLGIAVPVVLAFANSKYQYRAYVTRHLKKDLANPVEHYLKNPRAHFWVAELVNWRAPSVRLHSLSFFSIFLF